MELFGVNLDWVLPFVVVLTVLVFVHELGHYWVARRNGVRVEVFSIGFGPEIKGFTDKHGTRWKFSAIPLGGYVKMFGEHSFAIDDGEKPREMTAAEIAVSFSHKKLAQRAAIIAAGPIANFIFAIVVFAALFSIAGEPRPLAAIGSVEPASAAAKAGFQAGDRIVRINQEKVVWFSDLHRIIRANPGVELRIAYLRDDQQKVIPVTPAIRRQTGPDGTEVQFGLLGVRPDPSQFESIRHDPLTASWMAVQRSVAFTGNILQVLGEIVTGNRSSDELGGPVRIAQISGQVAQGGLVNLITFAAILSLNLGLINLFPIPVLDGGHLAFLAIEAVRGKPVGPEAQERSFQFGLILVLMLFVFVTFNDLVQLKFFEFIKDLFT